MDGPFIPAIVTSAVVHGLAAFAIASAVVSVPADQGEKMTVLEVSLVAGFEVAPAPPGGEPKAAREALSAVETVPHPAIQDPEKRQEQSARVQRENASEGESARRPKARGVQQSLAPSAKLRAEDAANREPTSNQLALASSAHPSLSSGNTLQISTESSGQPPAHAGGADGGRSDGTISHGTYGRLVSEWLAKFKEYPATARRRRLEGTTALTLVIDAEGKLISASIEHSSGSELLDQTAIAMAAKASPFPKRSTEAGSNKYQVTVPVSFKLL